MTAFRAGGSIMQASSCRCSGRFILDRLRAVFRDGREALRRRRRDDARRPRHRERSTGEVHYGLSVRSREYRLAVGGVDRFTLTVLAILALFFYARSRAALRKRGVMNTPGSALEERHAATHAEAPWRRAALTFKARRRVRISLTAALFFLLPLYVVVTSVKPMSEIRLGNRSLSHAFHAASMERRVAVRMYRTRLQRYSSRLRTPCVSSCRYGVSIAIGAVNGYALSFWRRAARGVLFGVLPMGAFIPVQVMVSVCARAGERASVQFVAGIVVIHTIFGMPAGRIAAVSQLLRVDSARTVQGRAHRRWRFLAYLYPVDAAPMVDADHCRGDHHAGDAYLERLHSRPARRH